MSSYSSDASELQSRKLADLAFLVQLYDTAFTWYHTAKRDFHNDNAMLHYAGAVVRALDLLAYGLCSLSCRVVCQVYALFSCEEYFPSVVCTMSWG